MLSMYCQLGLYACNSPVSVSSILHARVRVRTPVRVETHLCRGEGGDTLYGGVFGYVSASGGRRVFGMLTILLHATSTRNPKANDVGVRNVRVGTHETCSEECEGRHS